MGKVIQEVDVIAQFKYDGEIIPLRFQLINEDGKPEAYTIKGYKRTRHKSPYKSVDDILVISTTIVFECQVNVQDKLSIVRLSQQKGSISRKRFLSQTLEKLSVSQSERKHWLLFCL